MQAGGQNGLQSATATVNQSAFDLQNKRGRTGLNSFCGMLPPCGQATAYLAALVGKLMLTENFGVRNIALFMQVLGAVEDAKREQGVSRGCSGGSYG